MKEWRNMETPTYPQDGEPNDDQTRSDQEKLLVVSGKSNLGTNKEWNRKILVHPQETRKELGTVLEIPSWLWSRTNEPYAQKFSSSYPMTVHNLNLAEDTMKVPQLSQDCAKLCKIGKYTEFFWFSQIS